MDKYALFTDVSLNPKLKMGVGAYFFTGHSFLDTPAQHIRRVNVTGKTLKQRFNDTSSTKLEVQTVIWAIENCRNTVCASESKLYVYTDSQCVTGLPGRRSGLEDNNFLSKRTNYPLKNALLYQQFYQLYDELGFEVIKVAGHLSFSSQDTVHRIFSYVEREVRKELKLWMSALNISDKSRR